MCERHKGGCDNKTFQVTGTFLLYDFFRASLGGMIKTAEERSRLLQGMSVSYKTTLFGPRKKRRKVVSFEIIAPPALRSSKSMRVTKTDRDDYYYNILKFFFNLFPLPYPLLPPLN